MLDNDKMLTGYLNSFEKYHDKILVMNMHYVDSVHTHPFQDISDCPVFMYRIDPSDDKLGGFSKRGQWALILRDQQGYSQQE